MTLAGCTGSTQELGVGFEADADFVFVLGRVVDIEIVPVPDVTVRIANTDTQAVTDADGGFRLGPVEPGELVVIAERIGYLTTEKTVSVGDAGADFVTLTLEPVAANVPYYSSRIFTAYFQCVTSGRPVAFEWNTSCVGLLDFATGMNVSQDQFFFPLIIDAPGFANLLLEMDWHRQAFGHDMGLAVWDPRAVAQTSLTTNEYASVSSAPPLRTWVEPGIANPSARDGAVFYPAMNVTAAYEIVVSSSYTNSTSPMPFALFLEHRALLIENLFFNRPGRIDFTALPDR